MPEESTENKVTFPKVFEVCPVCGSKKRMGATAIQQLKDDGILHKDSFPDGLMHQIPLLDQAHPPAIVSQVFKVKMIFVYWDVCECGTMYCTRFDLVDAAAQAQMRQPPPGPGFRGYNPGQIKRN
jgi:hypothetical protein